MKEYFNAETFDHTDLDPKLYKHNFRLSDNQFHTEEQVEYASILSSVCISILLASLAIAAVWAIATSNPVTNTIDLLIH